MAQANANTSTRRAFLSTAAGVAAAATVTPTALAMADRDPIFAAIEAHRAAAAAAYAAMEVHTGLENELPRERRKSTVWTCGEELVAGDDPRWINCERATLRAWGAKADAAMALVNVRPTTMAGIRALILYAVEADADGEGWPAELMTDDGKAQQSWHQFLVENVAAAIPQCV